MPAASGHGSSARHEASAWAAGAVAWFAATRRGTGALTLTEADLGDSWRAFCKFTDALLVGFPPLQGMLTSRTRLLCVADTYFVLYALEPSYRSGGASLDPNSAVALGGAADRIAAPWDTCAGSGSR